ncbi:MAG: MMPL family transporter [Acidimicrobiia bacterium]
MRSLARFVLRRRRWILGGTLVFLLAAGAFGSSVASHLSVGGFEDPESESAKTERSLREQFGAGDPDFILLVTSIDGDVDMPTAVRAGRALTDELSSERHVADAVSYWSPNNAPPLRSADGSQALVLARLVGDDDEVRAVAEELSPRYTRRGDGITITVGGAGEVFRQVTAQAEDDLRRAELLTAPLVAIALLVVFGSIVAATLPFAVAVLAVLGTFLTLTVLGELTQVSIFSLNLTTALGLGLAVDYSLFVVSRYREELAAGRPTEAAISRTMQTAGRTVAFSAATVAVSLAALLVFPVAYLRSFAYAGVAVVLLAGIGAVVVLPALLAVLGPRVERGQLWKRAARAGSGFWHDQATRVMRRPVPYAVFVVAVLLLLGAPFLRLEVGLTDDRVIPAGLSSRATNDAIRENFTTREAGALSVVADAGDGTIATADIDSYATRLSRLDSVARVDARSGYYLDGQRLAPDELSERFRGTGSTWLSVVPDVEPFSPEGEQLVSAVRELPSPFEVAVTGPSARLVDTKDSITSRLPAALGVVALTTFVLLFLMVGSVVVPLKALVLNVLSLTATFGAMVWVFQDGHLAGALDFTPTGFIDVFTPMLMFCIAFGLSMDYEVFLLSRIKEEYDLTGDNRNAVALGLQRTGRIVTAAAVLLALVFVAFATSQVAIVKLFGIGLALAVLIDAFLIRATLLPAFMQLAGRANWWAPRSMRRWHLRWGLWEAEPVAILDDAVPTGERG